MKHSLVKRLPAVAVFALLFIAGCKNQNAVNVVQRNFDTEIEQQQNLIFTFDKDLIADSLLDTWDTLRLVRFTPEVQGKFKWNNPRELVFSPVSGFAASTDYTCELQPQVTSHSRHGYTLGEKKTFAFHTPYLKLVTANGFWTVSRRTPGTAALMVSMDYNYRVDPGTAGHLTQLSVNNKPVAFEATSSAVGKTVQVMIDGIAKEEVAKLPVKVIVAKGMKSVESGYETKEAMTLDVLVPSPAKLEISTVTGEFQGTEAMIHVYTTQAVEEAGLKELLVLEPKIPFETEMTENGFYMKGAFTPGKNYTLEIRKNLKGVLGGTMAADYRAQVSFGEMEPAVSFVNNKGIYLSSKSSRNIAVNIVSIDKVHVNVYRVYENNILHYLRSGRYNDYWYDDEGYNDGGYSYQTYDMPNYGDAVIDRDYETKDLPRQNGMFLLNLSFSDVNPFKGIYIVQVASSKDQWVRAAKLVSVSDIGLISRHSDDEIMVFTNSIKSAQSIGGVKVSLVSKNNQEVLNAVTNSDGVAVFSNLKQKMQDFKVAMITAHYGDDFNYLMLNDARVNSSRFDVGGRRADATGLMAFLYGDRDIYRPGETIHLNTVVRNEQWQPQSNLPVKLKILMPNGKELKNMRGVLNRQGAFETSCLLPVATVTGTYIAEVFTANDVLLQSKNISVEEFIPDRIDVKLELSRKDLDAGDSMKVMLAALNMYGPPAAGRKYEIQYTINRKMFYPKAYPGYSFYIKTDNSTSFAQNDVLEGQTDEKGLGSEVFQAKEEWTDQGILAGKVFATVFDETGRPVNRVKTFDIYTQKIFYGMKLNDRYTDRGSPIVVPMVALDKNEKNVAARAQIQVVRYDWYSSLEHDENGGRYRWISRRKEVVLLDQQVSFGSKGYDFRFIPRESGEYEIRVKNPEGERYVTETFYSYGWGYTSNTSFEVNTEGQVDMKLDREKYKPGDEAIVVFSTPFNGRLLVTIECNNVIEYRYLDTEKKSALLKLPVKESYLPNVYVTATLFRPLDDGSIPLTVGHGFAVLKVEKDDTRLPVTILAVEKSRSKTKQTVTVKTVPGKNVELTIAVVDEGILALKNYATPDPHGFFYQKKALTVEGYDVYPNLLPDLKWRLSSSGGDGYDLEKRVNPLSNKRVQLVALWSGHLHTDANGEARYTFDIPQFSGDLRIMACAYQDKSFGSADKHMKVADPVVISAGIPRFLSPRDTLTMPVTLTNTTSKAIQGSATAMLSGPLKIIGAETQSVVIQPNSEKRVMFRVLAGEEIATGSISIRVNALQETFTDKTEITIRPSTSLLKISGSGEVGGTAAIALKHDFIPSTADARLVISANPMLQFSKTFSYLVGYPHGCLEQTTSKAFPQIYFSELSRNMKYPSGTDLNPATNVQAAIAKIQSLQQHDGGMTMWPGDYYLQESWWATAYATHFLLEARKAGYEVNGAIVDRALNYIAQKVKGHLTVNYYYSWRYDDYSWKEKDIYMKENFYSLYLMALYGKADISSMNYFKSDLAKVALDSRYMLACTYLAVGDRKSYDQLLPKSFEGEYSRNEFGGSFYSALRDMAISLNVLMEVDPDNPQVALLVRHLSRELNKKEWISTQEAAFSFLALGKFMKRIRAGGKVTASLSMNGKALPSFDGKDLVLKKGIAGQSVKVEVNGGGKLYYFWEIEGLSAKGDYKEEDKFLQVRKSFYDRFGRAVDVGKVKQGDLVAVKLTLINLEKSNIENVVVTDMLPAGFEIENPRIGEQQEMSWIKDQSQPQYFDVRDDRINFFTSIGGKAVNFYYLVRAVSTGSYRMGPVSADAMYNGEYHSYHGAGTVRITE